MVELLVVVAVVGLGGYLWKKFGGGGGAPSGGGPVMPAPDRKTAARTMLAVLHVHHCSTAEGQNAVRIYQTSAGLPVNGCFDALTAQTAAKDAGASTALTPCDCLKR